MRGPRLTLFIPHCFELFRQISSPLRLPTLELLLTRGDAVAVAGASVEQRLFTLFGVADDEELPVGAVRRVGDGATADEEVWYCADPVHLVADRDRLHLVPPEDLAVEPHEAAALAALFNDHFSADGWRLETPHPVRWYLRAPAPSSARTTPLRAALGEDLRRVLPQGNDALAWRRFLNEAQMLFHGSAVNAAREQRGFPAINGFWPWGGGRAPRLARSFDQVWAGDPVACGLAQVSGAACSPLPAMLPALSERNLVVLHAQPDAAWWQNAEAQWFEPVRAALAAGRLAQLDLETLGGRAWHMERAQLRRWWRRRQPVGSFA